jgi:hypothetical protein
MAEREVVLPSGRSVTIRRPGPRLWRDIYGGLPSFSGDGVRSSEIASNIDLNIRVVCACSVLPKFIDEAPEACTNGALSVDDLSVTDFAKLAEEIIAFSGAKEIREKLDPLLETAGPS